VQYDHGFKLGFALEQVSGIEIFNWEKKCIQESYDLHYSIIVTL